MERLRDERLVGLRAVALRGVEEIHAELDRAPEESQRPGAVLRLAPHIGPEHAHRPEAEAMDREVADLDAVHSSACFSSSSKSWIFSIPTDKRTSPSSIPSPARSSAGTDACVMIAGCSIRLSTPPRLSARVKSSQRSRKRRDAGSPPFTTAVTMPP